MHILKLGWKGYFSAVSSKKWWLLHLLCPPAQALKKIFSPCYLITIYTQNKGIFSNYMITSTLPGNFIFQFLPFRTCVMVTEKKEKTGETSNRKFIDLDLYNSWLYSQFPCQYNIFSSMFSCSWNTNIANDSLALSLHLSKDCKHHNIVLLYVCTVFSPTRTWSGCSLLL